MTIRYGRYYTACPKISQNFFHLGCNVYFASVSIRASEMQYEPKELHLKAGVPVHLTLVNDGKVLHDFNLQGIKDSGKPAHNHQVGHNHALGHNHAMAGSDSHIAVEPGKSAGLHFTPSAGEFAFYCSVPGHREAGMSGKILAH